MKKILLICLIILSIFLISCKEEDKKKEIGSLYVNYVLNNGNRDVVEKVEDLDTYSLLKVERSGYRFVNWYADEDLEVRLYVEDLMMPTGESDSIIYAYAKWTEEEYMVTFKCDGRVINTQFVKYGKAAEAPTPLIISGYKFFSWDCDFSKVTNNMEVNAIYVDSEDKNIMVILGNWMNDNGTISATMRKRLELALAAYKDFSPSYIVVSGGMANSKAGMFAQQIMFTNSEYQARSTAERTIQIKCENTNSSDM